MINFYKIRSIRHLLDVDTTANLCLSLCLSHMDYCNSILYGLPDMTISKMQRLQNMCAHLVLSIPKWHSAKQCLMDLHWLSIHQRIAHKILTHISAFTNAYHTISNLCCNTKCHQEEDLDLKK